MRQVRSGELRFLRARCVKLRYGAAGGVSFVSSSSGRVRLVEARQAR